MNQSFRDLEAYRRSYSFALAMKKLTLTLPSDEKYLLRDQINRVSRTIPAKIAEGWVKRGSEAFYKRQITDAIGACAELEVHLTFCRDFSFLIPPDFDGFRNELLEIGRMLQNMLKDISYWPTAGARR